MELQIFSDVVRNERGVRSSRTLGNWCGFLGKRDRSGIVGPLPGPSWLTEVGEQRAV